MGDSCHRKMNWLVMCRCGVEFDLRTAPWCNHQPIYTKLCPNGHCICHLLNDSEKWRVATEEEKKYGFGFMLKEEYGGIQSSGESENE